MDMPLPTAYSSPSREDGWTPERQFEFVEHLKIHASPRRAAAAVGMSVVSAYKLRNDPASEHFRAQWAVAVSDCMENIREIALDRALNGTLVPILRDGTEVGEALVYSDRTLIALLRLYDAPQRLATHLAQLEAAKRPAGPPPPTREELLARLRKVLRPEQEQGSETVNPAADNEPWPNERE